MSEPSSVDTVVDFCLQRVGLSKPNRSTLVVRGSGVTAKSADSLWSVWSDLATWPSWSPMHRATRWTSTDGFRVGATFDQELTLGFPVGVVTDHATVDVLEPGRRASWSGDNGGLESCHVWQFTPAADGGTSIVNVEVFVGRLIPLVRPLAGRRWNRGFQQAVDGLITTDP